MHDPKLEKAFLDSIKHYFDGNAHSNYDQTHEGERKFNKTYFDNLDQSINNPIPEDKKTKKRVKASAK